MNETKIQQGQTWLETLLGLMALPATVTAEIKQDLGGEASLWLTVDPHSLSEIQRQKLIGDRGQMLDAVQYLANITFNHHLPKEEQYPLTVDIDGYRAARRGELEAIATAVAQRVEATGEPEAIENLSSAERRQMHSFFKDFPLLKTESQGQEPHRHLIVQLA
ncbi:putative RNA-binding protein [[Synechococcus] sp. NIES-970]|uniref:Jag family protein n=1 Tax=Picosynechococcus sp. NKBG15041c TaxID=1407650 RepID=UPI0004203C60|nr:R3H domain-containing nucleic acid-binding protein [Picosynechococcus sp. NKBG15041c]BAW96086.1 putative RNA-binding protein [[Synechococcus] sp. NIES-970]